MTQHKQAVPNKMSFTYRYKYSIQPPGQFFSIPAVYRLDRSELQVVQSHPSVCQSLVV
jgi:hypothetical protein